MSSSFMPIVQSRAFQGDPISQIRKQGRAQAQSSTECPARKSTNIGAAALVSLSKLRTYVAPRNASRRVKPLLSLPTSKRARPASSQPQYTTPTTALVLPTRHLGPVTASNPPSAPLPSPNAWPAIIYAPIHRTASLASSRSTCLLMLISALHQQHTLYTTSSRARTTS